MKIKAYKCECGCNDFFFAKKGNQIGIYCSYCGKWLKWADKNEQNLAMKQEYIFDKIRDEIDRALSEESLSDNRQEISDVGIGLEIALSIIDKYKEKSRSKE